MVAAWLPRRLPHLRCRASLRSGQGLCPPSGGAAASCCHQAGRKAQEQAHKHTVRFRFCCVFLSPSLSFFVFSFSSPLSFSPASPLPPFPSPVLPWVVEQAVVEAAYVPYIVCFGRCSCSRTPCVINSDSHVPSACVVHAAERCVLFVPARVHPCI